MPSTNALIPAYAHPPVKTHQPLRERCSVRLTVQTTFKDFSQAPVVRHTPVTQVTPHRVYPEWHNFIHYDAPEHISRSYHLQEIIDGLYVAFAEEHEVDTLCVEAGVPFSHVLRIEPVDDLAASGSRSEETMVGVSGVQKLTLKCLRQGRSLGNTTLNASQLLAARDYISLIMPYSSRSVPKPQPPRFNVQLLVVAPADRAVDVMSVVVCYLAFSSGHLAETVMQFIGEEEYDAVWKAGISQECLDFVERIARVDTYTNLQDICISVNRTQRDLLTLV